MKFSSRLEQISPSRTLQVMLDLAELRSKGADIIDLGPGEPDFMAPDTARHRGIQSIREGSTRYTAVAGLPELRQAVARRYNTRYSSDLDLSNVSITSGAKQAIFNICFAVFEEGDEVIIPAPYWVTFPEAVKLAGAKPRIIQTRFENGFIPSIREIEQQMTPSTRGLIINTPNNPTGAMMPGSLVRELIEFAISRKVFLLFDETYDFYTYEDQVHHSLVSFADAENPYYAVVGSFSKTYAMTGWRLGYGIGAADLIKRVNAFQSHTTGNACTISQRAALSLLERGEPGRPELLRMFSERRQFAVSALSKIPGFLCPSPAGSFYVFPKVESCIKRCGLKNSTELSRFLLNEAHVATVPGDAFGTDGYLRISYATPMENLEEGIRRIQQALA